MCTEKKSDLNFLKFIDFSRFILNYLIIICLNND